MDKDTQNEERLAELEKTRRWLVQEWKRVATYGRGPNKARTLRELSARARALLMEYSATVGVLVMMGLLAGCAAGKVGKWESEKVGGEMTGLTGMTGMTNGTASLSHSLTFPLSPSPTFRLSGPAPTVTLEWDRSPATSVVGYNLYLRDDAGSFSNRVMVGSVTNVLVGRAPAGATFYYGVSAVDAAGRESERSNELGFPASGGNTNTVTVWAWVEASTNLVDWKGVWDLPIKLYLSNQPPVQVFRARAMVGWNQ